MSAAVKTHQPRKFSVSVPAIWIVLGLAAALFLLRYGQEVLMEHDLSAKVAIQLKKNAEMQDQNNRLQASLEYYKSDKYIEQRAREDLNLRRADEEVIIPIGGNNTQSTDTTPTNNGDNGDNVPAATSTGQDEDANWQKWFDLFSPFASGSGSP